MTQKTKGPIFFILGLLLAASLVVALLYLRRHLFTRTNPIVLDT